MSTQPHPPAEHPVARLCAQFGQRLDKVGDASTTLLWSTSDADLTDLISVVETQRRRLDALQAVAVAEAGRDRGAAFAAGAIDAAQARVVAAAVSALPEVCRRALARGDVPGSHGFPAHVAVTIGYEALRDRVGVGPTSLDNGVLLCGAHHRLVHRGEWTVRLAADRRPELCPPAWIDPDRQPAATPTTSDR